MIRVVIYMVLLALVCACGVRPARVIDPNSPEGKARTESIRSQILSGCTYTRDPKGPLRSCLEIPFVAEIEGSEVILTYPEPLPCIHNLYFPREVTANVAVKGTVPPPQKVKIIPEVCPSSNFTFKGVDLTTPSQKI